MPSSRNSQRPGGRSGRQNGMNGHAYSDSEKSKKGGTKAEFKDGDTVIFNVRSVDNPEEVAAVSFGDGLYKKPK